VAFAAGDGISGLKLVEAGVPKDKLALLAIPLTPLQIALPWVLGRYTAGPRPMNVFQKAYPYKFVFVNLCFINIVT
jgi:PAT family acetyl-CoA transporter-like MFS transporter 1